MSTERHLIFASADNTPCDKLPVWIGFQDAYPGMALWGAGVNVGSLTGSDSEISLDIGSLTRDVPQRFNDTTAWGPWRYGENLAPTPSLSFNRTSGAHSFSVRLAVPASWNPDRAQIRGLFVSIYNAYFVSVTQTSGPSEPVSVSGSPGQYFPMFSYFSTRSMIDLPIPRVDTVYDFSVQWAGAWE